MIEPVGDLLRAGLEAEQRESLQRETNAFFKIEENRLERLGFQADFLRSLGRGE